MSYLLLINKLGCKSAIVDDFCNEETFVNRLKSLLNKHTKPREGRVWTPDAKIDLLARVYGIAGYTKTSMVDIGKELGISRSRISRLVEKTIDDIRESLDGVMLDETKIHNALSELLNL